MTQYITIRRFSLTITAIARKRVVGEAMLLFIPR